MYEHITVGGRGDPFDRHVFACALNAALREPVRAPTEALGLYRLDLEQIFDIYLPAARSILAVLPPDAGRGSDAIEEPDLRQLLLDNRSHGTIEEEWLAAIVARRALQPNHLWQDLGLFNRQDLSRLLLRHFRPLAERNTRDMKWKKFFYRELCSLDGVLVCKAPVCDVCTDFSICFGSEEEGEPLARLQTPQRLH